MNKQRDRRLISPLNVIYGENQRHSGRKSFKQLPACSACARRSSILAELTKPAALPIFKNSRLSMATPFRLISFDGFSL